MSRATANRDPCASHAVETASYDGGRDKARWPAKNGPLENRRADEFEDPADDLAAAEFFSMYMALRRTRDRPRRQALVVLKVRRTGGPSLQQGTGPNLQCKRARFLAGNGGVVAILRIWRSRENRQVSRRKRSLLATFQLCRLRGQGSGGVSRPFEPGHKQFRDRILLAHRGFRLNPSALPKRKRSIVHRHRRMIHSNTNRATECSRKSWGDGSIASYRRRATALAVCASLLSPCRSNGIARRT
jgi:hypothetical protein